MYRNRLKETLEALGGLEGKWPWPKIATDEYNKGFSDGFICAVKYLDDSKKKEKET